MKNYLKRFEEWSMNESQIKPKMTIDLDPESSEALFFDALANGLDYLSGYGLELTWDDNEYRNAKETLKAQSSGERLSYEDVLMQILRDGGSLSIIDHEGEGDADVTITLEDVIERVKLTPYRHLMDAIEETGDADTADAILQTVFFGEVIFG